MHYVTYVKLIYVFLYIRYLKRFEFDFRNCIIYDNDEYIAHL